MLRFVAVPTETLVLCILIPSLWVRPRSCSLPEGVGSCLACSCAGQLLLQALHLYDPPKARVVAQVQPRTHMAQLLGEI
jgi:hypothetical protein